MARDIPKTPPAYRPVVQFDADELQQMHKTMLRWLTTGQKGKEQFKLWTVVRGMLHQQVRDKIASEVVSGRSGPNATLRAQRDFAQAGAFLIDIIDKVDIPAGMNPEEIMAMLRKPEPEPEQE